MVEAFIITNGRNTFEYALKAIEAQTPSIKFTVIRDMKWTDALNKCVDLCESEFYVRVDDDMFLHHRAIQYMEVKAQKIKNIGAYICKLWEDWSGRPGGYVKIYNTNVARKIRFRANKLGKVDKPFFQDMAKTKYKAIKDDSLVGIHACGSDEDEEKYRQLWLKQNATVFYEEPKELDIARKNYNKKDPEKQFSIIDELPMMNKKIKSGFWSFTS